MNKRKLPKAVTQTADEMRQTGASDRSFGGATAERSERNSTAMSHLSPGDGAIALSGGIAADQQLRLSKAKRIVERHSNFSALGGVVPVPLLNVAGVTTIIVRMVKHLCRLYGVPYQQGRARAIVVGLAGGAIPTTASAIATSTLVFVIPGVNLLGLAVSSVAASVCTRSIGLRFIEHFETGASLLDFPVIDRR